MEQYKTPVVLMNEELAEGVYAASGAVGGGAAGGDATAVMTSCDHYGNYYFTVSGLEDGATYKIVLTVTETSAVHGLTQASWGDYGGVVSGNTATIERITLYANQTSWHARLWFESQGGWEMGWQLQDSDIPSISVVITKLY